MNICIYKFLFFCASKAKVKYPFRAIDALGKKIYFYRQIGAPRVLWLILRRPLNSLMTFFLVPCLGGVNL